ncbi:MAG: carbamoyltransferase [Rhodospirillales bacterium]|nr:carbamoyltransferase [Alphaproteobacteria bacterium]MBL6948881.1 carbamoyltransferase [Rhodospirillales bacterium]
MIILGLHFGHDAGIMLLRDGRVERSLIRERHNRVKHAFSIDTAHIDQVLDEAGLGVDDVDMIALTSTQCYELVSDNPDTLTVIPGPHPDCNAPSTLQSLFEKEGVKVEDQLIGDILGTVYGGEKQSYHHDLFPEYKDREQSSLGVTGYLSDYIHVPHWGEALGLEDLAKFDHSPYADSEEVRMGFHYPFTVRLHGRDIPAYMIQHHACHAASSYYPSGFRSAAVMTHDGAFYRTGHNNGMVYRGDEHRLFPLTPHHLHIGDLYDQVGSLLGFGLFGAAGKLMGLAPYGKPRFFDRRFAGNTYDLAKQGFDDPVRNWVQHCLAAATDMGYDLDPIGDTKRILEPVCIDLAASTQKLFEETILHTAECTSQLFRTMKRPEENLCYAGGTALSCPTNSRLFREGPFLNLYIPPDCDDSGLSMGAALYLYHNILDNPLPPADEGTAFAGSYPYLGGAFEGAAVEAALEAVADRIDVERSDDWAVAAAEDIAEDRIVAWYEGRSEIGPRALGHRSLLANPGKEANWERVNDIKTREKWRPFAPAVLEEDATRWFRGAPAHSPHMLFTAQVSTTELPAITHVDGSSRVQTVSAEVGDFYRMLKHLKTLTGFGVVLNTSFNGPGEPIMERPEEALVFLLDTELDALYMDDCRITRRESS